MEDRVSVGNLIDLLKDVPSPEGLPSYRAVAHGIRVLTMSGRLPIGGQLPGERVLAEALGVSRTTVVSVYRVLTESGVIETSHGKRATLRVPTGSASAFLRSRADGVLDLVSGSPMPHDELLEALYREAAVMLPAFFGQASLPALGLYELRELIAQRFTDRGLPTSPEEVLVTAGAVDGLRQVFDSLTKQGDAVMVEMPTYPVAASMLTRGRRTLIPYDLDTSKVDVWDSDRLADAYLMGQPRAHYTIPDGHNPTGAVMSEPVRRRLASLADASSSVLIIDETTAELSAGARAARPLASYVSDPRMAVTVGSLSKLYWPGLRVGWVRASAETIASLCLAPTSGELSSSIMDQLTAIQVFRHFGKVRQLRQEQLDRSRTAVLDALAEYLPDAACIPRQGFTLWVRLPTPVAVALFAEAERSGVRVSAGSRFGMGNQFSDHIRIPLVQSPEVLREGVRRLSVALERFGHSTKDASST